MPESLKKPEKNYELTIARTYDAPAAKVFRAWADPKRAGQWLAPGGRMIGDARVDGLFYLAMLHGDRSWAHYGRYVRVEAPRLLEFTWVSEATHGLESLVTIEFREKGGRTELTLHHEGLPNEDMQREHTRGWTQFADELVAFLANDA